MFIQTWKTIWNYAGIYKCFYIFVRHAQIWIQISDKYQYPFCTCALTPLGKTAHLAWNVFSVNHSHFRQNSGHSGTKFIQTISEKIRPFREKFIQTIGCDTAVHYPPKGSRCACHSQRRVSVLCAAVDVCGVLLVISKLLVLLVIAFHMSKFESWYYNVVRYPQNIWWTHSTKILLSPMFIFVPRE